MLPIFYESIIHVSILEQGADLEAKDKHGISVVLAAIWEGHSKCVAFLISKVS